MTFSADALISSGLLPENLPPVFTSEQLAVILSVLSVGYEIEDGDKGDPCVHNASKRGGTRRIFSAPGPFHVRDQALFLENHWAQLTPIFENSKEVSASIPALDEKSQRYVRITPHSALPGRRLPILSRYRFCLVADVSRFYYSIYTHAFPWAIHGKDTSKSDRKPFSTKIWGNRLDFITRQSQLGQTIGVAVGPDTSRVIAEILLCAVDRRFKELSGQSAPRFVRHVDDYWIGGNTYDECEKHLQNLRLALKYYQLDINESKTRIISTKYVFSDAWPTELENGLIESLTGDAPIDPITAFGRIIEHAIAKNDDGLIRSVIKKMDRRKVWEGDWDILEHFLAQCAVQFPHSFDYVARVVALRNREHADVDFAMWTEIALQTIRQCAPLGRDSETVWALWLLKELGQIVPTELSDHIVQNNGGLVLAYLAHFPSHGLAEDADLITKLKAAVEGNA